LKNGADVNANTAGFRSPFDIVIRKFGSQMGTKSKQSEIDPFDAVL
jgi:hypothetical protein